MSFEGGKLIWLNRRLVPWEQATVHVLSHALHYGSSVFEGIRVYKTPSGPKVFRLTDHMQRLFNSAKIHRLPIPYERDELIAPRDGLAEAISSSVAGVPFAQVVDRRPLAGRAAVPLYEEAEHVYPVLGLELACLLELIHPYFAHLVTYRGEHDVLVGAALMHPADRRIADRRVMPAHVPRVAAVDDQEADRLARSDVREAAAEHGAWT